MEEQTAETPPDGGSSLTIVCSDCSRNGKTLFAKLAADLITLRHGKAPTIYDTAAPEGVLQRHFPAATQIIDLSKTREQVALFDGILAAGEGHFLIDLVAHHFKRFFDIYVDIGFEEGARQQALDCTVFFLIDRAASSVEAAAKLHGRIQQTRFVPVRNSAIGDALAEGRVADTYHAMRFDREILLPELSSQALGLLEHPDFHFDGFVAGHYEELPFELKAELWDFLESLYEQRKSVGDGSTWAV